NVAGLPGVTVFAGAVLGGRGRGGGQVALHQAGPAHRDGHAAASRDPDLGEPPGNGRGAPPTTDAPAVAIMALLAPHGGPEIALRKLDWEGAEGAIVEGLAAAGHMHLVGWVRGEWHYLWNLSRLTWALAPTHVFPLDRGGPEPWGSFLAHR